MDCTRSVQGREVAGSEKAADALLNIAAIVHAADLLSELPQAGLSKANLVSVYNYCMLKTPVVYPGIVIEVNTLVELISKIPVVGAPGLAPLP